MSSWKNHTLQDACCVSHQFRKASSDSSETGVQPTMHVIDLTYQVGCRGWDGRSKGIPSQQSSSSIKPESSALCFHNKHQLPRTRSLSWGTHSMQWLWVRMLEVKCSFKYRSCSIQQALVTMDKDFSLEVVDNLQLKRIHRFYARIQTQIQWLDLSTVIWWFGLKRTW